MGSLSRRSYCKRKYHAVNLPLIRANRTWEPTAYHIEETVSSTPPTKLCEKQVRNNTYDWNRFTGFEDELGIFSSVNLLSAEIVKLRVSGLIPNLAQSFWFYRVKFTPALPLFYPRHHHVVNVLHVELKEWTPGQLPSSPSVAPPSYFNWSSIASNLMIWTRLGIWTRSWMIIPNSPTLWG